MDILVVGCGIFGVTAALELRRRGHRVRVLDDGPPPRPNASSTDTSRAVRLDYGGDDLFTELAERSLPVWREWDAAWRARGDEAVLHEDGFVFLTRTAMQPGEFEFESFALLTRRGWALERLDAPAIRRRYPAFDAGYVDGYLNPHAGWVESGRVVQLLAEDARDAGVEFATTRCASLLEQRGRVTGVEIADGTALRADVVVLATGVWTPLLVGELSDFLTCAGQALFYLAVEDPAAWRAPRMPVFGADIAKSGWYGFPATAEGVLKIGHHGPGRVVDPDAQRTVLAAEEQRFREFVADCIPVLRDARIVDRRLCPYCDSFDGAFLIDHDPAREGLVVATGGSGHGFKFAPVLGGLTADAVEGIGNPALARFRWRRPESRAVEASRSS